MGVFGLGTAWAQAKSAHLLRQPEHPAWQHPANGNVWRIPPYPSEYNNRLN
jgi:hypothetical protein